jgi:hypothetical protein
LSPRRRRAGRLLFGLALLLLLGLGHYHGAGAPAGYAEAGPAQPVRRVNVPYETPLDEQAILWFGRVDQSSNYANVRLGYDDGALVVHAHVVDHWLWYDTTPAAAGLTEWDAVTFYLDTGDTGGASLAARDYRFDVAFNPTPSKRADYQAAYQGNGAGWSPAAIAFTTEAGWRGTSHNSGEPAQGWWVRLSIPFASLELPAAPPPGTTWGLAVRLYDRDEEGGPTLPVQGWPEAANPAQPSSWGQLRCGLPAYTPPPAAPAGVTTIRHGENGAIVADGHVGGHTTCGAGVAGWNEWGEANWAGRAQVNVQNQWDVADWRCHSKYYVVFPPLSPPVAGQVVLSATLRLHQFGSAGQGESNPSPETSHIQVLTVAEEWDEATITWNNAPLALENIATRRVEPLTGAVAWPGVPVTWDISRAAAAALAAGDPLSLVLYSADTAYHSGRYFYSSDANLAGRPTLEIRWGTPTDQRRNTFLPLVRGLP